MSRGGARPGAGRKLFKLSREDRETIWLRYQLWAYNRPADIARAYGISHTTVDEIGKSHAHATARRAHLQSHPQPLHRGPLMAPQE